MKAYHWRNLIAERDRLARLSKGEPAPDAPPVNVTLPPKNEPPVVVAPAPEPARTVMGVVAQVVTTDGRRICMECTHYAQRDCTNNRARNPVTGWAVEASSARKDKFSCGPTGRYWEPRFVTPRVPRAYDDSEPQQYVPPVPVKVVEWKPYRDEVIAVLWKPGMYSEGHAQGDV